MNLPLSSKPLSQNIEDWVVLILSIRDMDGRFLEIVGPVNIIQKKLSPFHTNPICYIAGETIFYEKNIRGKLIVEAVGQYCDINDRPKHLITKR